MTALFLAPIKGQLFGINKEWVAGVGACKIDPHQSAEKNGRKYLRLPTGERTNIFDFQCLLDKQCSAQQDSLKYYLILHYKGEYTAIPIHGRGQWASVTEPTTTPLPPAFARPSKELIPRIIINGNDIILLPDMDTLFRHIAGQSNAVHDQAQCLEPMQTTEG
ncbi:MAG: hypothetical protein AB7E77_04610 [Desulfobulbus sp.]